MASHQLPEVLGVVRVDEVAQLMDHHIIHDAVGCLDDVPVEDHLTTLVARPPAGPEIPNGKPIWRYTDLLGVAVGLFLEAFQGTGAIPGLEVLLDSCLPLLTMLAGSDGRLEVSP